jgi:hypothetical protein
MPRPPDAPPESRSFCSITQAPLDLALIKVQPGMVDWLEAHGASLSK